MTLQLCVARLDQGRVHHRDQRAREVLAEERTNRRDDHFERAER
jgi:hypothetical protein